MMQQENKTSNQLCPLYGADEIAKFMRLPPRTIYHLAEMRKKKKTNIPIWSEPGIGLMSDEAKLKEYMAIQAGFASQGNAS